MSEQPPAAPAEAVAAADILDTSEAGGAVIRGGIVRSGAYVAGVLLGLLSAPLMVRHLGVVEFGKYVTVTSLIFIVGGVTEAGLNTVGVRELANRPPEARITLLRNLQGLRMLLSVVGTLGALIFAVAAGYGSTMVLGTALAGLGLVITNLLLTYQLPLLTSLQLGRSAALDLVRQAATVGVITVLVILGASLLPFFAAVAFGSAVAILATVPAVRGRSSLRPAAGLGEWRTLLRETLPFAAATALGVAYYRVVVIFMSLLATEVQTGDFSVAFRIVEVAIGVPWLLAGSAFPILVRAARDDTDRLRYAMQRLFDVAILAGAFVAVTAVTGAAFAIRVVAGDTPGDSVRCLQILGVSLFATFLVATWGFSLLTLRVYRALVIANAGALVLAAAASAALIPPYGATGGAVAATVTEAALALAYGLILAWARPDLRPRLAVVPRVMVATAVAVVPALLLDLPSVVLMLVSAAAFLAVAFAVRAVPQEVAAALLRRGGGEGG